MPRSYKSTVGKLEYKTSGYFFSYDAHFITTYLSERGIPGKELGPFRSLRSKAANCLYFYLNDNLQETPD